MARTDAHALPRLLGLLDAAEDGVEHFRVDVRAQFSADPCDGRRCAFDDLLHVGLGRLRIAHQFGGAGEVAPSDVADSVVPVPARQVHCERELVA